MLARRALCVLSLATAISACGAEPEVDPTPEKLDGTPSSEFEPDDIDRAEGASEAVKDYCSGAVSEAQRIGCESHVNESDVP